jgi:MoxR-like ATPase
MSSRPAAYEIPVEPSRVTPQFRQLEDAISAVVRGKPEVVRLSLVALLARGHLLLEDVPGVGKTTLAQAIARAVDGTFHRLQFTSDMLPSDVLGVTVYNAHAEEFEFKPGPIFANFLLADEINRATPKTQSALLEAMNEQQVSVEGKTLRLPDPFMVIATQNPAEHHGTYPLPESQLDRFLMRLSIGYPERMSEREIIRQPDARHSTITPVIIGQRELLDYQEYVAGVSVDAAIVDYMLSVVEKTRTHEGLALGVSPRGSQALYRAVQALAAVEGRTWALPDDVKRLAPKVFGHRVVVAARSGLVSRRQSAGSAAGERIIEEILGNIEVPL